MVDGVWFGVGGGQHLLDTWDTEETTQDVKDLLQQAREDGEEEGQVTAQVDSLVQYIHRCMDGDRKVTALKQLQGHVWRAGYHSGQLKGDLFPDVVPFLQVVRSLCGPINRDVAASSMYTRCVGREGCADMRTLLSRVSLLLVAEHVNLCGVMCCDCL